MDSRPALMGSQRGVRSTIGHEYIQVRNRRLRPWQERQVTVLVPIPASLMQPLTRGGLDAFLQRPIARGEKPRAATAPTPPSVRTARRSIGPHGGMKSGVPTAVISDRSSASNRMSPESRTSLTLKMFAGFTCRCTTPASCKTPKAWVSRFATIKASRLLKQSCEPISPKRPGYLPYSAPDAARSRIRHANTV